MVAIFKYSAPTITLALIFLYGSTVSILRLTTKTQINM